MSITRWDPFRELEEMSDRLNRVFARSALATPRGGADTREGFLSFDWAPSVDIAETPEAFEIKAELPDVRKEDVKVSVEEGQLRISGERKQREGREGQEVPSRRAQLWLVHAQLLTARERRRLQAQRGVQRRRAEGRVAQDGEGQAQGHRREGELRPSEQSRGQGARRARQARRGYCSSVSSAPISSSTCTGLVR